MSEIYSFDPIFNENSRVLILGTMPGPESLRKGQYYGNPRNQFWRILFDIFDCPLEVEYEKRVAFLLDRKIALWDVVSSCQREGALDSKIKNEVPNDILSFLENHPEISHIFFNGKGAEKLFNKFFGKREMLSLKRIFTALPSTSPTPSRHVKTYKEKQSEWAVIVGKV